MVKPKIIVKPKRLVTRKQRKTTVDTSYLLDENKKVHKRADNELVTVSSVMPISVKQKKKKTKKEYVGRKKNRKKTRKNKKGKRLQGQQDYIKKGKKKKRKTTKPTPIGIESKPTPIGIESKPTPIGIESKPTPIGIEGKPTPIGIEGKPTLIGIESKPTPIGIETKPIPSVDIFDQIEDYIMDIPDNVTTWRRGQKGYEWVDLEGFKMACISIVREYSMSENPEIKQYFSNNEYAIKEAIDSFHNASTENDINDYKERLLNLLGMDRPLSAEQLDILSLFENY